MNSSVSKLDQYLDAATRPNTRRSYEQATRHFEIEWGGHLPATPDSVARYLAHYAGDLAINTLKHRLAALAKWHADHGFADPTRTPIVRKVLKGIQAVHVNVEKQAPPLQLTQLGLVADWLENAGNSAQTRGDRASELRYLRDRALMLLGFWRGFRGDELLALRVEHLHVVPGQGMTCFLARTKGDRENAGRTYKVPALSRWCPVAAVAAWVTTASLTQGPVFGGIDRWGGLSEHPLHANSLIPLFRRMLSRAGLASPETYSSHSLRRGFAGWADANGWDVKTLMQYVGWKDVHSAMRYIDGKDAFAQQLIESQLPVMPKDVIL
ncbi:site-specific recombinase XerD [Tahibacter aquaticus]|uniref:Site-specific recombinase XerD n=1 Tax=Tahibacter aquaticus TaxID=520092 RepID=A0A4R6YM12_9GAMM|nr:site-specific recombinase XerD [Tahibacter aquaticus]